MFPGKRLLLLALAVAALLHAASVLSRRVTPAFPGVPCTVTGSFTPDGQYPGEPFASAVGVRLWGSWSGSDDHTGTFELGPFPAPRILRFGAGGYPGGPGNALHVERVDTGERRAVPCGPLGERWAIVDFVLPAEWAGRPIRLHGADQARGIGGWFAVSEPVRGGRGDGNHALLETLAAWAINAVLLGVLHLAALRVLASRPRLAPHWIPLGAAAVVAAGGYLLFWIYFFHPLAGVIASWGGIAGAAVVVLRRAPAAPVPEPWVEAATVVKLTLAVGAFHLGVLHLFPTPHDFYTLAANRFREAMPSDNMLPHDIAGRLFAGEPPKNAADEWRSSDRPPLQTGWQLLTWPAGKALGLDRKTFSGTSAVWFQLLWVAGLYGLLRTFGVGPPRATGWVAACALAGFFLQNTTYTWPKLSAGAFASGAFVLLVLPPAGMTSRARGLWASLFAVLGWLSHGGVAFSYLPLLPWIAWRMIRGEGRAWLPGAAVCAAFMLPWMAYQKFYDPPGNMLLKQHLAGQAKRDDRGFVETLRDNYARLGAAGAWENKVSNFHAQVFGRHGFLFDTTEATKVDRRNQEFFHAGRALTWWPFLALVAVVASRRRPLARARDLGVYALWLLLTVVAWCLLLFGKYQAVVHHGSYALMMGWFVLFSVVLDRAGRGWLALLAVLQTVTLATTWAVSNPVVHGPPAGLFFVLATGAVLAWYILRGTWAATPPEAPASGPAIQFRAGRIWRAWWSNPTLNGWVLLALAAVLALRKPHALHTPQLWAEDGSIFLLQADLLGLSALVTPYMGYLHTLPRLIAALASALFDPAWWPAFYNGVAFALWIAVLARFFTARFSHLPGRPWLVLAFVAVAHPGEVYFNITNLQWLTAFILIQQLLIATPLTRAQAWGDAALVAVVGLTGPFAVAVLPLFAWRAWRERRPDTGLAFAAVLAAAAIQAWLVIRTSPRFEHQAAPFQFWPFLEVFGRRLVMWPVLGRDAALSLPPAAAGAVGGAFLAAVLTWALRPHERRPLRLQVVAAFGLIALAGMYRTRPDTWGGDNLEFSDRYFYIPRVLLAWLVVWELDAGPRAVSALARVVCLAGLLLNLPQYVTPAPRDYEWAKHVEPIRQGVSARIPILPENWILEYQGRPRAD
ncbi:MAG: hypothetical protein JNL92_14950 [Opitutaceae bacterium]|nr:hypothetical protein [Opitutaceae bacterium]